MTASPEQTASRKPPRRRSRWLPLVLVAALSAVYWVTHSGSEPLEGWGSDLEQALAHAGSSGKHVVVFLSAPG